MRSVRAQGLLMLCFFALGVFAPSIPPPLAGALTSVPAISGVRIPFPDGIELPGAAAGTLYRNVPAQYSVGNDHVRVPCLLFLTTKTS